MEKEHEHIVEVLKKVPLFQGLTRRNLDVVANIVTTRHYEQGAVILKQGENGIGFFIIESGQVEVRRETGSETVKLAELGAGEFFGEMGLFEDTPRSATVVATTLTSCYVVTSWHFKGILEDSPTIAVQMLPIIVKRLQQTEALL